MRYRGAVIDVDGTVLRGDQAVRGAIEGLSAVAEAGLSRLFFSNNPTRPPAAYEARFERVGLSVSADEVVTAGTVTATYLRERHVNDALFVVGESGLVDQLLGEGLSVVTDPDAADLVVASWDRSFDYDTLCQSLWALSDESVGFVGTDPDMVVPGPERDIPGSGAVINAIGGVAGREPDTVLGKPSAVARETVVDRLGHPPESLLVVGDRLDTDIALGADAGMTTVLVRTGVTDDLTLANSPFEPDYVLDSIGDIDRVIDC
ncbi:MAG: HAD-IIA family hydrolase [Halobacteriota archaeon]